MKRDSRRPEQVAETVRQVVADALLTELRDPRIGFVTVTAARVSNDLSHATVLVSVMGEAADKEKALEGLRSAAGFLRSRLGKVLASRVIPELSFELDRGLEHAQRINHILAELRAGERKD
jgi:ribosome-binding factor A